jgi:hypothetical protein
LLIIYLVVFGGFACLFPLAFYCLVLASLNGRRRPTLVPGPADFAGVLLATAGFLIVGGPLILAGLHDAWRRQALRGSFATIRAALNETSWPWLAVWAAYFVLVVGGAAWLLLRRRAVTLVYNIDPADAPKVVPETLDRLGLNWARRSDGYYIGFGAPAAAERPAFGPDSLPVVTGGRAVLDVAVVPAMRHMTLRWSFVAGDVRRQVEAELRRTLAGVESPENPAAGWLLTAATAVFALLLAILGLFVTLLWRMRG